MYRLFFEHNNFLLNFNGINYLFLSFLIILFFFKNSFKNFFLNRYEKNIDCYFDLKNYIYIYLTILFINFIYFFFNNKQSIFFLITFFNFLTTSVLIISFFFIDPFKFTIVLSGFNSNKNWIKNLTD